MSEKLTLARAKELLAATTTEGHLFEHALAVSACMGAMARHFGADEAYWQAVGYLHDYDFEQFPDEHLRHTEQPLRDAGVDEEAIRAILAHGYGMCSQVKPETDLEVSSLKKKFKDKKFAAKIDRDVIRQGCEMLGMPLEEVMAICIEGMKPVADQLGIGPKA